MKLIRNIIVLVAFILLVVVIGFALGGQGDGGGDVADAVVCFHGRDEYASGCGYGDEGFRLRGDERPYGCARGDGGFRRGERWGMGRGGAGGGRGYVDGAVR